MGDGRGAAEVGSEITAIHSKSKRLRQKLVAVDRGEKKIEIRKRARSAPPPNSINRRPREVKVEDETLFSSPRTEKLQAPKSQSQSKKEIILTRIIKPKIIPDPLLDSYDIVELERPKIGERNVALSLSGTGKGRRDEEMMVPNYSLYKSTSDLDRELKILKSRLDNLNKNKVLERKKSNYGIPKNNKSRCVIA